MPVEYGSTTKKGKRVCYAQYETHGKKYFYECGDKKAREAAYERAALQGKAIRWRQHAGAALKTQTIRKIFGAIDETRETWYDLAVREDFFGRVREEARGHYAEWGVDIIKADEALEIEIAAWSERAKYRYHPLSMDPVRTTLYGSSSELIYEQLWDSVKKIHYLVTVPVFPEGKEFELSEKACADSLGLSLALISMLKNEALRTFFFWFNDDYSTACADGRIPAEICRRPFSDYFISAEIQYHECDDEALNYRVEFPNLPIAVSSIILFEAGVDFEIDKDGIISYCIG